MKWIAHTRLCMQKTHPRHTAWLQCEQSIVYWPGNIWQVYDRYIHVICRHHSWQLHACGPAGSPNRSLPRHPCTLMVSMWACSGPWHEVFSYQPHMNISLCRMEYFIMQNRIFHYAEWNILLCRMEYFIMQNGIYHYAEWNISLCRMEYSYIYKWILK